MAQSDQEIAKEIVVALMSRVEGLSWSYFTDTQNVDAIGKAAAKIYQLVLEQVKK